MRKIFLLSLAAFFLIGVSSALAEPIIEEGLKHSPNVSVLPFKDKSSIPNEISNKVALRDAAIVSDFLLLRLWHTGRFGMFDREDFQDALNEIKLQNSGLTSDEARAMVGKIKNVQYIVKGNVTNISSKNTPVNMAKIAGVNKQTVTATISVRFVNIETGEMVLMAEGWGESSRGSAELDINPKFYETPDMYKISIGSSEVNQIQVRNALYKAVIDAVKEIEALLDGSTKQRKV